MRKLTIEEVKDIIEVDGYKLISKEYKNVNSNIDIKCPNNHIFKMRLSSFKQGSRCPYCIGNAKLTIEEVREYIENEGYKLISETYVNNKDKLKIKCPNGHYFEMSFNCFKKGYRCKICSDNNKRNNIKEIKTFIENEDYILLSNEYKNNTSKLKILCPKGHEFEMSWDSFNGGHRCPICSGRVSIKEVEEFIDKEGYKLISDKYIRAKDKIDIKCPEGHIFKMSYQCFKRGQRCPICYKNSHTTIEDVKEYMNKEGYILLSTEYVNGNTHLDIMCPKGHNYKATFHHFKSDNTRCPYCNFSKGEDIIEEFLKNNNIVYKPQYKFDDCKYKRCLPFDFYLPDFNSCIEFDGEQHYKPVEYFGGEESFKNTVIRDNIKTEYCKNNNIKLIRIPYYEINNIDGILTKELNILF